MFHLVQLVFTIIKVYKYSSVLSRSTAQVQSEKRQQLMNGGVKV